MNLGGVIGRPQLIHFSNPPLVFHAPCDHLIAHYHKGFTFFFGMPIKSIVELW
jgi:hypothetical protein